MKKIYSILLINIVLFHSFGILLTFLLLRESNYKEVREKKNEIGITISIAFAKADIKLNKIRFTKEDEFSINGKMFDVLSKFESGDSVYFTCFNDEKEEQLLVNLENYSKSSNARGANDNVLIKPVQLQFSFFYTVTDSRTNFFSEFDSNPTNFNNSPDYSSLTLEIPDPPPKKST